MAFITSHNFSKILRDIRIIDLDINGDIYKNEIYFFNQLERKKLLELKSMMGDTTEFIDKYYDPVPTSDTKTFVFEKEG